MRNMFYVDKHIELAVSSLRDTLRYGSNSDSQGKPKIMEGGSELRAVWPELEPYISEASLLHRKRV